MLPEAIVQRALLFVECLHILNRPHRMYLRGQVGPRGCMRVCLCMYAYACMPMHVCLCMCAYACVPMHVCLCMCTHPHLQHHEDVIGKGVGWSVASAVVEVVVEARMRLVDACHPLGEVHADEIVLWQQHWLQLGKYWRVNLA